MSSLTNALTSYAAPALRGREARAVADALESAPAAGRGEQPNPQAPLLQAPDAALPPEIQDALLRLIKEYELESDAVRRHWVKRYQEAEEFWRGNQILYWSEREARWRTPAESGAGETSDESPRYDYVTNIYKPLGATVIAALTQRTPRLHYLPVSALSEDDIATARAASRVQQLVERNNNLQALRIRKAYLLWNQGAFATYTRFKIDGDRYGYHDEPVYEDRTVELAPARLECGVCGGWQPSAAPPAESLGDAPGDAAGDAAGEAAEEAADDAAGDAAAPALSSCASCGGLLGPGDFRAAARVTVPVVVGTRRVPNGAETLDVYGPLFFKVPPQAQDQRQCYYLIVVEEQHKAALRAAYPALAGSIDDTGSGAEDTYERIVRLSLTDAGLGRGTMPMAALVTYKRAWLRPEAFWAHADDGMRRQLLTLFPEGCRVEIAGSTFLQAVAERLDDVWVLTPGLPGVGFYREPLGADVIPLQKQLNDTTNILAEHREMSSAPPIIYDARYLNGAAFTHKRMEPASYIPALIENAGPSKELSSLLYQPRLGVDPALWNDGERLTQTAQFVSAALPSMFGGGVPDLATASAYAQSREQAMGRLSMVARQMREAEAREMTLAIEAFRRNRTADAELVVSAKGGGYRSEFIRLNEIRGNVIATPVSDDDFPSSWSQTHDAVMQLLNSRDEEMLKVLGHPINRGVLQNALGLPDFLDPTEDNRSKQFREIEALLAAEPLPGPDGRLRPSLAPEPEVDDHGTHIDTLREWAVSDAGLENKAANPGGYANVIAHLRAHVGEM